MKRGSTGIGDSVRHQAARIHESRVPSVEWIRTLPGHLLEPHPLVKELRDTLEAKDATLADREREIARLQVALAFGLKELPLQSNRVDKTPAD